MMNTTTITVDAAAKYSAVYSFEDKIWCMVKTTKVHGIETRQVILTHESANKMSDMVDAMNEAVATAVSR